MSESWSHRFFELSTQLLAVMDPEGRLLQTNPAWGQRLGWTPAQLLDGGCSRFVHPEDLEPLKARLRALGTVDTSAELRCRWRCANGAWMPLGWSVVSSAAEGRLYCTLRPLEPTRPPSLSRLPIFSGLSDELPFGFYLVHTGTGHVLYANPRFLQMARLESLQGEFVRGELTHARVLEVSSREAPEGQGLFCGDGAEEQEASTGEVELPTGQILRRLRTPLRDAHALSPYQMYVFEDVTHTRRTLEALRRAEQGFRKLIERLPDGIFVFRQDRKIIYANPTLCAALGYERPETLLSQPITKLIHPDSLLRVHERMKHVVAGGTNPLEEVRFLRRDGSTFEAESTSLPIEFDGRPAVAVVSRDITERKRLQAQLLQTDRMVMVGTLAAGVGHEINNPLSYILTNIRLSLENIQRLEQPQSEPERVAHLQETREMLQEAHEGGLRVRDIVRDLKQFSRRPEEHRREVDVSKALEFSLKMAMGELRHRARIIKNYEPSPAVFADESRLGQVFLNLLMNAAQALPEGEAHQNELSLWVRPSDSGGVLVDVSDTGSGIAPEVLGRIFEPFFTTKPVGMGTGLGLSICHGIVREFGGELTVRSELGRGTTFTVHLPAISPQPVSVPKRPSIALPAVRKGRMLVIDNEAAVARSLARIIGPTHHVMLVRTGHEGIARLTGPETFDVVFCDLTMPDATGTDIYEQVRELRPELAQRFIFMTGGAFTPRTRRLLESMPERCLEKPFDEKRLQKLIHEVLRVT